jgi:hypothetical protein
MFGNFLVSLERSHLFLKQVSGLHQTFGLL